MFCSALLCHTFNGAGPFAIVRGAYCPSILFLSCPQVCGASFLVRVLTMCDDDATCVYSCSMKDQLGRDSRDADPTIAETSTGGSDVILGLQDVPARKNKSQLTSTEYALQEIRYSKFIGGYKIVVHPCSVRVTVHTVWLWALLNEETTDGILVTDLGRPYATSSCPVCTQNKTGSRKAMLHTSQ